MSQVCLQNAIGRFTYDWLIRFCELHPTNRCYSTELYMYKCEVPLVSKYSQLSTLFTSLLKRYMPIVMRDGIGDITNNEIYGFEKPAGNKMVLLTKYIRFLSIEPGTITKYNNERIYFNMSTLSFLQGVIDPDEFKFLLKQCRNAYSDGTKFSQPVLYSEIWTMFRPYMKIFLDIENLIFDDKMREMLKKFPQNTPKQWKLLNLSLREEIVLPIVENLITSPSKSYLHLEFGLDDYGLTCEKLANIAEEMVLEAGFVVEKGPATADMLRTIAFEKESNHICIYYLD